MSWTILSVAIMLSAAALGFFLNPVEGGPGDFLVMVVYAVLVGACIAFQIGREEDLEPMRRLRHKARGARQGR
jgi:hypothetical protein